MSSNLIKDNGNYEILIKKHKSENDNIVIKEILINNNCFNIKIIGNCKKKYLLNFSSKENGGITCNCPDFMYRSNICKHIFFIIGKVSKCYNELNNIDKLDDIYQYYSTISNGIKLNKKIINSNKSANNNIIINNNVLLNSKCSICQINFSDNDLWKCNICKNIFHSTCINQWWLIDSKMKNCCAVCRSDNSKYNSKSAMDEEKCVSLV